MFFSRTNTLVAIISSAIAVLLIATSFCILSCVGFRHCPDARAATMPLSTVIERYKTEALPGGLDEVPVLNSNCPEQVQQEGILVSTCSADGMKCPDAHLNFAFDGRFDIFAHHVAKGSAEDLRTLFIGVLLRNPGKHKVQVKVLSGASYLSQPDAPFVAKDSIEPNNEGTVYSGPGSRVMSDVLRNQRAEWLPEKVTIPPQTTIVLASLPIPVRTLTPHLNGRSLLIRLQSNGPVNAATLAMYEPSVDGVLNGGTSGTTADAAAAPKVDSDSAAGNAPAPASTEAAPIYYCQPRPEDWCKLLRESGLAGPREKPATPPGAPGPLVYGRVAGVSKGSAWLATLRNGKEPGGKKDCLLLPDPDLPYSFVIASLALGTFGTGQIQSAPLLVRYPETAYRANGNYGVHYIIEIPLYNNTASEQQVSVALECPIKSDNSRESLSFYDPPPKKVFFRGTVLATYIDDDGSEQRQFYHLVLNQGEKGQPLVQLRLKSGSRRNVRVEFLYPPDATPPQVLTIQSQLFHPLDPPAAPAQ